MSRCTYIGSCPFPNDKLPKMPVTTNFMVENYCSWDFARCRVYRKAGQYRAENMSNDETFEDQFLSGKILNWLVCGGIGW